MNVTLPFPLDEKQTIYKTQILKGENKVPGQNIFYVLKLIALKIKLGDF